MSIVSEESSHASSASEEISPAELESLRAQVQAIDEAAVPQQTIGAQRARERLCVCRLCVAYRLLIMSELYLSVPQ